MPDGPRPRVESKHRIGGDGEPGVFCADEQAEIPVDLARWQRLALNVLHEEGVRGLAELAVIFISEGEISELNESYMGASGPTDVLAFPIDAPEIDLVVHAQPPNRGPDRAPLDIGDMPLLLGDVVICPAVAERQAASHAGNLDDELALLVVHGVLHVLGHDHADSAQQQAMRARELQLLQIHHWGGPVPATFRQEHTD